VKKAANGGDYYLFDSNLSSNWEGGIKFPSTDNNTINVWRWDGSTVYSIVTAAIFRDTSAWYHIVVGVDTTQSTSSDRIKIYVNGVEQVVSGTYPSQNADTNINAAVPHAIGRWQGGAARYFTGYLADIHFIDGQALDPTSFGEFDDNGIWQPIDYTGSFGTNGFHLPFDDNSTAAALGYDAAGSNDWTVNNISVTAGAGNDSLVDVPTNGAQTDTGVGGEVRGNYCTLNPLSATAMTLSNGNLVCSTSTDNSGASGTFRVSTGKWYFEATCDTSAGSWVGWMDDSYPTDDNNWAFADKRAVYSSLGKNGNNGNYGATYTTGDIIGCAIDLDNGTVEFYKNGASQGTMWTGLTGKNYRPIAVRRGYTFNFGQRAFAYQTPGTNRPASTYKALCTANLPAPLVTKPNTVMDVKLYTGNGSTQTISGLGFSPDLVWIKSRNNAGDTVNGVWHILTDTVRGNSKNLFSNSTFAEVSTDSNGYLSAFTSDGFTVAAGSSSANNVNNGTGTYAAWTWDAGSSTVTNTQGSITSSVRANATAGFSIVTYTGNGTDGATVGHGLGVAPELIILKARGNTYNWGVWHKSIGKYDANHSYALALNLTRAADGTAQYAVFYPGLNSSTVFGLGNEATSNQSSATYVAYCFAPVVGYTSASSYTGNGSADGPFVFTNMRPRWILIKRTDTTSNWTIIDTAREGYNVDNDPLFPNLSNAEGTTDLADILSNGFKLRTTDASVNANTGTYIYFAIAEAAFNYSRAR
jgi:hypothetical protein